MGFHYIHTASLDTALDVEKHEALVYAPGPNGQLQLAAVEYIVPAEAWDGAGNAELPTLHVRSFHLNEELGVYVLHAWAWKNNPAASPLTYTRKFLESHHRFSVASKRCIIWLH